MTRPKILTGSNLDRLSSLVGRVASSLERVMTCGGDEKVAPLLSLKEVYRDITGNDSIAAFSDEVAQSIVFLSLIGSPLEIDTIHGNVDLSAM
nr:hypothetical protein [Candidatus Sigynarchaeota archaeon]